MKIHFPKAEIIQTFFKEDSTINSSKNQKNGLADRLIELSIETFKNKDFLSERAYRNECVSLVDRIKKEKTESALSDWDWQLTSVNLMYSLGRLIEQQKSA